VAKKFYKGRCVYCLNSLDGLTSDHVFPQSWYPGTTPPDMEKWQAPACRKCNSKMGKIENRLLIKIGLCVPPFERQSLGIAQKAMRSLKPEYGRDEHDAELREKLRRTIIEKAVDPNTMPLASILPKFGFHSGVDPSKELGVLVSAPDLEAIGEKLIRGTTWVLDRVYIDTDHNIHIIFPRNPTAGLFFEDLRRFGTLYSLGPGLTVVRAAADGDCQSGIYLIEIWGRLHMYGCVAPAKNQEE
jgi:hypothetical protein